MAQKVWINGEVFEFDPAHRPMVEALALEEALKTTYGQWEEDLSAGSAKALAGLVWMVWRRNGRHVEMADILSGAVPVDLGSIDREGGDEAEPGPTRGPAKGASNGTGGNTSARSPSSSASAPGKPGS